MKIQGPQPTQNATSYSSPMKASAQKNPPAVAQETGDIYAGKKASLASNIMVGQDLSNISRNDLKGLTDKLYEAGVITGEQRLDLTAPYADQLTPQMQSISNPDEKRNFLTDLNTTLETAKRLRPNDTSSIAYLEKVNNLANSLAAAADKV